MCFFSAEEILHAAVAHWWSGGSTYICYAEIDDTRVPQYQYPSYGTDNNLYGTIDKISYPKVIKSEKEKYHIPGNR